MGVANMNERTIEKMERNNERQGNLRTAREDRGQNSLRRTVEEIIRELGAHCNLYDVREELGKDVLYFDGIMPAETREKLLAKLAEKLGTHVDYYKIVAFHN